MTTKFLKQGVLFSFILSLAACGGSSPDSASTNTRSSPLVIEELATYDARFLEIDACPNVFLGDVLGCPQGALGTQWAGDANLYVGLDKDLLQSIGKTTYNDPSQSYAFPGNATIDWNELLADATKRPNHVRFDYALANGKDPDVFGQSNSCVESKVLGTPKMDLTAIAVSNNATYAYFGVQRSKNDGDAGYMWLFTKEVPLNPDPVTKDNCGPTELRYRLTDGDVMFRGHFVSDITTKLLFVYTIPTNPPTIVANKTVSVDNVTYTAVCPGGGKPCYIEMPAKSAINWLNGLWSEKSDGVAAAAVNASPAGAGTLGLTGVISKLAQNESETVGTGQDAQTWKCTDPAGCMDSYIFAEVAVPTAVFTGGGAVCGATFYGTVITRPSGNTASPDMKDVAGPYQFNFGSAAVTASATPSCNQGFNYKIDTFTGLGLTSPSTCNWSYKLSGTSTWTSFDSDCSSFQNQEFFNGTSANLNGTYDLKVTAGDGLCSAETTATVNVYPPVDASATMTGSCTLSFTYDGTASGGSGNYTTAWAFSGPGTITPSTSSTLDNPVGDPVDVSVAGTYSGTLTVTDNRTDITGCNDTASPSAVVYSPVQLALAATPASLTCDPTKPDDDIDPKGTFTATASGGSGISTNYEYHWAGVCTGTATNDNTCDVSDATTCQDETLSVYATDKVATSCGNTDIKYGKYTKITTITTQTGNSAF